MAGNQSIRECIQAHRVHVFPPTPLPPGPATPKTEGRGSGVRGRLWWTRVGEHSLESGMVHRLGLGWRELGFHLFLLSPVTGVFEANPWCLRGTAKSQGGTPKAPSLPELLGDWGKGGKQREKGATPPVPWPFSSSQGTLANGKGLALLSLILGHMWGRRKQWAASRGCLGWTESTLVCR